MSRHQFPRADLHERMLAYQAARIEAGLEPVFMTPESYARIEGGLERQEREQDRPEREPGRPRRGRSR